MPQQRYHIHVCLVKNEQPDMENALQLAAADDYFLTWDLQGIHPKKSSYSREQIDRCDYVLFILGNEYGKLSPSGVGYLHLNYVYATTKRKPMFAVIKAPFSTEQNARQRLDFSQLIQKEQHGYTATYRTPNEGIKRAMAGLTQLLQAFPGSGWQKNGEDTRRGNDFLFTPKAVLQSAKPSVSSTLATENTKPEPLKSLVTEPLTIPILPSDTLALEGTVLVSYSTHAYQDGNLSELTLTHSFSWQEILSLLKELPAPFSTDAISRKLNEYLGKIAFTEAVKVMPNAHAASRSQINSLDFNWIRKQLVNHHFLIKVTDERGTRELWQLNPQVK